MAWRLCDSVVRGEVDNRIKGLITGRLWLKGMDQPVELKLQGNACADIAGCLLQFRNPNPTLALDRRDQLNPAQHGKGGDLTASRKVRLPQLSEPAVRAQPADRDPLANSLYLEWYSGANGRVVIEATGWDLKLSPPEWHFTPADEEQRSRQSATGLAEFLARLDSAIQRHKRGQKDPEADWNEQDYEKFFRECDARNDKYRELLEKYGDYPDGDAKIDEAMGWTEPVESPFISEEEMNLISEEAALAPEPELDPLREGIDWVRTESGDICHPFYYRCFRTVIRLGDAVEECVSLDTAPEELRDFIFELQTTSAKLAGALNSIAADRGFVDGAFTVAYLKRALGHLHKAQAGLESPATLQHLPATLIADARKELLEIRQAILDLMDTFRREQ